MENSTATAKQTKFSANERLSTTERQSMAAINAMDSNVTSTIRRPSLLSVRRPPTTRDFNDEDDGNISEDGTNFRKSLQIDMKGLVGDAVGNMSISPSSRDVVLAARRGLFIIDLESPLQVPRFLPQGGTWDVADVQWNPHRPEYIVSTSSEKLLIWNLYMSGKTSIEHILHSHYRAITDINWHTTERDTVVSTGIDSWVWAWDMREPRKPIFGLCAFSSPGTQVKWNRQNSHILASSHADKVLIWDRRKGSLPVTTIDAHKSRIYGIDWSHTEPTGLISCSLDKTIKVWDSKTTEIKTMIQTAYPVWRARSLPFGHGILSLAQRGETALEMYGLEDAATEQPVDCFQGHSDVVKEFVWRKGAGANSTGNTTFQLITWSKDRTLRFWPVDLDMMQKVGHSRSCSNPGNTQQQIASTSMTTPITSFRNPLRLTETSTNSASNPNPISAPIGHRSILAEVRASGPQTQATKTRPRNNSTQHPPLHYPHLYPYASVSNVDDNEHDLFGSVSTTATATVTTPATVVVPPSAGLFSGGMPGNVGVSGLGLSVPGHTGSGGGTMSRGAAGGKSRARVDALSWLSSVKVESTTSLSGIGGAGGRKDSQEGRQGSRGSREGRGDSQEGRDGSTEKKTVKEDMMMAPENESQWDDNIGSQPVSVNATPTVTSTGIPTYASVAASVVTSEETKLLEGRIASKDCISRESKSIEDRERETSIAQSAGPSLQDEITSVLSKLPASKVRLEKHDLTNSKKRTCTLGLQVPWARSSSRHAGSTYSYSTQSVFLRVTFTFPREYPHSDPNDREAGLPLGHPLATPTVTMENTPLITIKDRAFMLRRLRRIREGQRPCLEACLRFLVFKDENMDLDGGVISSRGSKAGVRGDDSSSDESEDTGIEENTQRRGKEVTMSLLRDNKNLAEPRTCQGSFGPNGELVCFFRAPPRIVRNAITLSGSGLSMSHSRSPVLHPSTETTATSNGRENKNGNDSGWDIKNDTDMKAPSQIFHQSPSLVSDAVRRLSLAATDRRDALVPISSPSPALATDSSFATAKGGNGHDLYGTYNFSLPDSYPYPSHQSPAQIQAQIIRIMTNLLTFPRHHGRRHSNSLKSSVGLKSILGDEKSGGGAEGEDSGMGPGTRSYATLVNGSPRRSEAVIANTTGLVGGDKCVAQDYIFSAPGYSLEDRKSDCGNLVVICDWNASVAKAHGRYDHERIFKSLGAVLGSSMVLGDGNQKLGLGFRCLSLVRQLLDRLLSDLRAQKDVQMLAMVAVIALRIFRLPTQHSLVTSSQLTSLSTRPGSALDYFSALHGPSLKTIPISSYSPSHLKRSPLSAPGLARSPSPPMPLFSGASFSSSRGSWSNLFNTGRHLMTATLPASDLDPVNPTTTSPARSPPLPSFTSPSSVAASPSKINSSQNRFERSIARRPPESLVQSFNRQNWNGVSAPIVFTPPSIIPISWNESLQTTVSFPSAGSHKLPTFSQVASTGKGEDGRKKSKIVFEAAVHQTKDLAFSTEDLTLLLLHVHFYSDMLSRWQLYHKRAELLKSISMPGEETALHEHSFGLVRTCTNCTMPLAVGDLGRPCESCGYLRTTPKCTVCRLSVKGLSINCLRCFHVTHILCWKKMSVPACPSGCACLCTRVPSSLCDDEQ